MLISLTVGKVDAGVTVLLTPDKRLIEFPSILLPPDISSGSIVDITVAQNTAKEEAAQKEFRALQDRIYTAFGASEPTTPALRCRNATQTSVVLEWDPIELATADLISLSLYRNGQKAGNIPRPLQMHSTKISGLAVDTEYTFHLVLRTTAGTYSSERVTVSTHKMTDLSGITITTGILPGTYRESLAQAVDRIGAKIVDGVRIDTTHFVTTEGRGQAWEKAVENNIPVVRPEWVEACEKSGRILGVTKFYLDAMRPGPPSEEAPLPPVPQTTTTTKTDSQAPDSPKASEDKKATEDDDGPTREEAEAASEEDEDDEVTDDGKESPEQKAKIAPEQEEQKVRLEDKEAQKVALRPAPQDGEPAPKTEIKELEDDDEDEDDEEQSQAEGDKKQSKDKLDAGNGDGDKKSGDGASFQDVAL